MRHLFIVFICLLSSQVVSAEYDSIFKILDEQYIENISELPYSMGTPEKIIQSSGNIRGWIDVVGFRDVIHIDGIDYINSSPTDKAIIQYDAWGESVSVDSVTKTTAVYISGNNIVAQMNVTLFWHYYYSCNCNKKGCSTCRKNVVEHATFYDYEPVPQRRDYTNQDIKVTVRERNFTIINTTDISVEINNTIYDRYLITTNYGYFKKINRVWRVEKTLKGVYYANETKMDIFRSHNLSHTQNIIPVNNLNFNVTASGFYSSTNETNITKISQTSDPLAQFMNLDLIGFLVMFSALVGFVYLRVKYL